MPLALNVDMTNCMRGGSGDLTCTIYGQGGYSELHGHTSAAIYNRLSFIGYDAFGSQQVGTNQMAYDYVAPDYYSFSASQVRMVRDYLRFDRRITSGIFANDADPPYGGKPRLGLVSPKVPLGELDFNGDGKRDIVVYRAKSTDSLGNPAEFVYRLAPDFINGGVRHFGRLDDVPVPAFYDADDKTDQAFYRPGEAGTGLPSDSSTWYWCLSGGSSIPPECQDGGYGGEVFGTREDVPLPGLKLGALPTRYPAVYRPSNGTFYWRPVGGGVMLSRQVAVPGTQSVPLPGLYDADDLVDFATYDIVNARFDLLLSTENWALASKRIQRFPASYQPVFPTGGTTVDQRSGGLPIGGVRAKLPGGQIRSVFAVLDAASSEYAVSWDALTPLASPYLVSPQVCTQWVNMPLGGIGGNPNPRDTLAGISVGATASVWRRTPTATSCASGTQTFPGLSFLGDGTAVVVPDVSGDGAPDILLTDPEQSVVRILKSDAWLHHDHVGFSRRSILPAFVRWSMSDLPRILPLLGLAAIVGAACRTETISPDPGRMPAGSDPSRVDRDGGGRAGGTASGWTGAIRAGGEGGDGLAGRGGGEAGGAGGEGGASGAAASAGSGGDPDPAGGGASEGGWGGSVGVAGAATAGTCPDKLAGSRLVRIERSDGRAACIDQREVTQGEYHTFIATVGVEGFRQMGHCKPGSSYYNWPEPNNGADDVPVYGGCPFGAYRPDKTPMAPVGCVDHCQAEAYCAWAGKELCGGFEDDKPLTKAELQDPARSIWANACTNGGSSLVSHEAQDANACGPKRALNASQPEPVDSFPACHGQGPYAEILNLSGGVSEWVNGQWDKQPNQVQGEWAKMGPVWTEDGQKACGITAFGSDAWVNGFRCCTRLP